MSSGQRGARRRARSCASGCTRPWRCRGCGARRALCWRRRRSGRRTQSYCSALACGYSAGDIEAWAPLATLVLDASYEATLLAAAIEAAVGRGSGQVVLCGLGGGVFGNRSEWIEGAIVRAIGACATAGLRVSFAHHGRVDEDFAARVDSAIAADSRRRQAS